ncbi:hypothetical protein [Cerasicoccus arenae]|uniref:hypothetical protein n=1 Tax=Cerasicoccus arenae TaxID=424488 RepID=UPI00167A7EA4|nr:hypothetical protein [Cerasicoccus arenae]MBK1859570.1 hypothetical protein [Cerasicoccus arenae]
MRCLILLCLLFSTAGLMALPAGHRHGPPKLSTVSRLVGHWHSTSLSGDGVGLAVDNVVVEFHGNRKFKATVNMNIGGPSIYEGVYHAKEKTLTLHPVSQDAIPCTVTFDGTRKMTVLASASSVTVDFDRGAAPKSSGGWF